MTSFSPNYAFPNVSVSEDIIGPISINPGYRNTIGVVGTFNSGPAGAVRVSGRKQFASIYGDDESTGAIFVKTAMQQGATDFVVSRILPTSKPSYATLFLQSGSNPTTNEAITSPSGPRTLGLSSTLSYIGTPQLLNGTNLGVSVKTEVVPLTIPNFEGVVNYDFTVVERVADATFTPVGLISNNNNYIRFPNINNSTDVSIREVTIFGADLATLAFVNALKPGLYLNNTSPGTNVFAGSADGISSPHLPIRSYPILIAPNTWTVLVEGTVLTALGASIPIGTLYTDLNAEVIYFNNPFSLVTPSPAFYVIAYNSRTAAEDELPSNIIKNRSYINGVVADSFLKVRNLDKGFHSVGLFTRNLTTGLSLETPTNIRLAFGDTTAAPNELVIKSQFTVSAIQTTVKVGQNDLTSASQAFEPNLSVSEILIRLQTAFSNSYNVNRLVDKFEVGLTSDPTLNTQTFPYTLKLTTAFEGEEANRVYVKLNRYFDPLLAVPTDILFGLAGVYYNTDIKFTEGADALKNASLFLYDALGNPSVLLQAVNPGNKGNKIKVTVVPKNMGEFRIEVEDTSLSANGVSNKVERYILNNNSVDPSTGLYTETIDSTLIRAFYVPVSISGSVSLINSFVLNSTPQRVAPILNVTQAGFTIDNPLHPSHRGIAYLKNLFLTGGYEPATSAILANLQADYLRAIASLETADVAFICTDNTYITDSRFTAVHAELQAQAERSNTVNGIRTALIATPPRLTPGRVRLIKNGINSNRVILVAGWSTFANTTVQGFNNVSPLGYYAGKLAAIPPHVSPASISEAGSVAGVITLDHDSNPDLLNELSLNNIDAIYYDTGSRSYKVLNGRNSSTNGNDYYVSVRRQADHIISSLYANLQWARSAKHDTSLRSRVASSCDAFLNSQAAEGRISGFVPTVCDSSNNIPTDIAKGILNIRVVWTPVYPADFIRINIVRDVTAELTLSL